MDDILIDEVCIALNDGTAKTRHGTVMPLKDVRLDFR